MTRLQELVKQATHDVLGVKQLDSIILAELIVKECAAVCVEKIDTGSLMAPQAPWMAKQILEHFGLD